MPDLSVCARWLLGGGVEEGVHDDPRSACGLMTVRGEGTGRCTWGVGTHMKLSVAGVLPSCTYILVACCLLGTPESLVIACSSSFTASTISANLAFSFILLQTKRSLSHVHTMITIHHATVPSGDWHLAQGALGFPGG